jgi:CubicO group peptidase (beta-lactamase class C family)
VPLLPETGRQVDEIVARVQARGRVPSVVAAVVRDGVLAHFTGAGDLPKPDPDMQYRIGSISKTLTAALVLQLRDEGKLALDDRLDQYLPGVPVGFGRGAKAGGEVAVTLRHLLGHVSGMQREPDGDWWERSPGSDLATFLAGLTPGKLAYPPYRGFHYSNLAYGLLGAVLQRLTGTEWALLVTERLLKPLGMTRTTYHPTEPFARGYVVHPWHGTLREEPRHDARAMAPAGQLWSTAADLVKWAAFLADPDPDLLAPATVAEMCAPVVMSDLEAWTYGYGLGLELFRVGERVFAGHGGSMPGYLAHLTVHRPSRTGVVVFANAYGIRDASINGLSLEILGAVLDREPGRPAPAWRPSAAPPAEIAPLCGRWWWMGREYEMAWDAERSELVMSYLGRAERESWRFTAEGTDTWRGRSGTNDGELLVVRRDAAGAVEALDIATFIFSRTPDGPQ